MLSTKVSPTDQTVRGASSFVQRPGPCFCLARAVGQKRARKSSKRRPGTQSWRPSSRSIGIAVGIGMGVPTRHPASE